MSSTSNGQAANDVFASAREADGTLSLDRGLEMTPRADSWGLSATWD